MYNKHRNISVYLNLCSYVQACELGGFRRKYLNIHIYEYVYMSDTFKHTHTHIYICFDHGITGGYLLLSNESHAFVAAKCVCTTLEAWTICWRPLAKYRYRDRAGVWRLLTWNCGGSVLILCGRKRSSYKLFQIKFSHSKRKMPISFYPLAVLLHCFL